MSKPRLKRGLFKTIKQHHKQHNYLITNSYQMAKKPSNLYNRFEGD